MNNSDYISSLTDTPVGGLDRNYHLDESGTLEHLLDVCQDASLGARLAAEALASDADLAGMFHEIAAESDEFSTHLALRLSRTTHDPHFDTKGTFRGKLFQWRLRLAGVLAEYAHHEVAPDATIGIVRRGSDHILRAYEEAEGRPLSTETRRVVHRQAERIRRTNARIHELV